MTDALFWTSVAWALVFGWTGARVTWHMLSLREYMGVSRAESRELGARSARGLSRTVPPGT